MDKKYITFPQSVVDYAKKMGWDFPADENNGMVVEGIFDYGCKGDPGPQGIEPDE